MASTARLWMVSRSGTAVSPVSRKEEEMKGTAARVSSSRTSNRRSAGVARDRFDLPPLHCKLATRVLGGQSASFSVDVFLSSTLRRHRK